MRVAPSADLNQELPSPHRRTRGIARPRVGEARPELQRLTISTTSSACRDEPRGNCGETIVCGCSRWFGGRTRTQHGQAQRALQPDDAGPGRTAPHRSQPTITDDEVLASSQPAGCARAWTRMFTEISSAALDASGFGRLDASCFSPLPSLTASSTPWNAPNFKHLSRKGTKTLIRILPEEQNTVSG